MVSMAVSISCARGKKFHVNIFARIVSILFKIVSKINYPSMFKEYDDDECDWLFRASVVPSANVLQTKDNDSN